MKLSWRYQFLIFIVILTSLFLYKQFTRKAQHSFFRAFLINNQVNKFKNKTYISVARNRVKMFVADESNNDANLKTRSQPSKEMQSNYNHRLSKLIFQLWDPNNYRKQDSMLNCENLVSLDKKKYYHARRLARKLNRKFYEYVNVSDIWNAIKDNCMSVRNVFRYRKTDYGPDSYSIAYTISLDRTAEQSLRMLSSIYHHENIYCIHPNAKFGLLYINVFKRLSECLPNIILPDKLYDIKARTFHVLKAELGCFSKLLNSSVPWKYGINLPSSAFPLRNNSYIVDYLKNRPYENVISWSYPHIRFYRRIQYVHILREIEGETHLVRTGRLKQPPPDGIPIFRKGNFFISTREFYYFLTRSDIAKRLLTWAQDTKTPDDFYYSTLYRHGDAPGGYTYDPREEQVKKMVQTSHHESITDSLSNDLLVTLWKSDRSHHCHGQYRGHVCIFSAADLRWLIEQDYLFASSFDFRADRVVIDCLSRNLLESILPETSIDNNDYPSFVA